jgi:hypothetical protein
VLRVPLPVTAREIYKTKRLHKVTLRKTGHAGAGGDAKNRPILARRGEFTKRIRHEPEARLPLV